MVTFIQPADDPAAFLLPDAALRSHYLTARQDDQTRLFSARMRYCDRTNWNFDEVQPLALAG